jgi:hypothetical protein
MCVRATDTAEIANDSSCSLTADNTFTETTEATSHQHNLPDAKTSFKYETSTTKSQS